MSTGSKSLKLAKRSASVNRDYFCQTRRRAVEGRPSVQVRAMTGYGSAGVDSLRWRRLTRATDLFCVHRACPDEGTERSREGSPRLPSPSPISNRELDFLERELNHCKQRTPTVSNRELSTVRNWTIGIVRSALPRQGSLSPLRKRRSRAAISDTNSRPLAPSLTGSASQTEFDATPTKQRTGEFLTGSRIDTSRLAPGQPQP